MYILCGSVLSVRIADCSRRSEKARRVSRDGRRRLPSEIKQSVAECIPKAVLSVATVRVVVNTSIRSIMMSHWAKNFTRVGRDGFNLARAVVQHRGTNLKPILLDHARQSNSVATSLLHVDKEVGLVKYYGLSRYVKQRLQSTSALTASNEDDSAKTSGGGNSAKIAFMVTASMKQDLSGRLGYDEEQVKAMTPLQASLILNENIKPQEMDAKLPIAEQEYEAQRQNEEVETRLRAEQEQQSIVSVDHQPAASTGKVDTMDSPTEMFGIGEGYMSRNELANTHNVPIGAFFSASEWFEVTETNEKGETSRVGLYQDKEEAELGLKTRQDIAKARKTTLKFGMNRIDWKDLE